MLVTNTPHRVCTACVHASARELYRKRGCWKLRRREQMLALRRPKESLNRGQSREKKKKKTPIGKTTAAGQEGAAAAEYKPVSKTHHWLMVSQHKNMRAYFKRWFRYSHTTAMMFSFASPYLWSWSQSSVELQRSSLYRSLQQWWRAGRSPFTH